MAIDFNYFLGQKYALLRQNADAESSNANTNALTGAAQANNLNADAGLTAARTAVLPGESKANIALQRAQTGLYNEQASVVRPESIARIGQIGAETGLTNTQSTVLSRRALSGIFGGAAGSPVPGALGSIFGASGGLPSLGALAPAVDPTIRAGTTSTAQQPGETHAAWVERLRAAGY